MPVQLSMFGDPSPMPKGFQYRPDVISAADETSLLELVRELPFKAFEFHGYLGKRRVAAYGWSYDFTHETIRQASDIPPFLLTLRETAAQFAAVAPGDLQQALVKEYSPGAGIAWHRDTAIFGDVIGISLLSPCSFRLRRKTGTTWERASVIAEPRSAYLLRGTARAAVVPPAPSDAA